MRQTFKARFGTHPMRAQAPPVAAQGGRDGMGASDGPAPTPAHTARQPPDHAHPTAQYLAMAWRMEELIREGSLKDYREAGRWLGVSATRASMLSHMIFLSPQIQQAILLGETRVSEHLLRAICREPRWDRQTLPDSSDAGS